ncbi:hypothetical protein [Glycomyces lechevalierae]|uniref:Sulfotransferase family protein n=1 Tax=Glycomyces lechevalierae TaxID=256034 RepID=A0A9X3PKI3_9ACTN|nr:hypothetical protein [Glycomyces lechevalierae]MDA1387186.1 hypothetical protein [Glycomyces lechevalierae]MDR7338550.1 hypothetical protein [Glycomyces lechevalierae]
MTNVFVLCTGRCGSVTFARACEHLDNFSVGHESRARLVGSDRLDFPDDHIEVDNRLSWFLGRLAERYDHRATKYVHLLRDPEAVAQSHLARWDSPFKASSIRSYGHGIVMGVQDWPLERRIEVCRDYVATVTANIEEFLRDRESMTVHLETAQTDFPKVLEWIGAEGDLDGAVAEWDIAHNASSPEDTGVADPGITS